MELRSSGTTVPIHQLLEEGRALVEEGSRPVRDAASAATEQAWSVMDDAADSIRSAVEPRLKPFSATTVARRVSRAADELRGAGKGADARTLRETADRERLRAALVAGIVLALLSAVVFLVAREIANQRAASVEGEEDQPDRLPDRRHEPSEESARPEATAPVREAVAGLA